MDDYFDLKKKMNDIKDQFIEKLDEITQKNGYKGNIAWFNFNSDEEFSIIWNLNYIDLKTLNELESNFGTIKKICTSRFSDSLTLIFKRESKK